MRPNELVNHVEELSDSMNEVLSAKWSETRGIDVISVAINTVTIPEEDQKMIKELQKAAALKDPTLAAATLAAAKADAMKAAAANENGAAMGFMGMGMAMNSDGTNAQDLFAMGSKQAPQVSTGEAAAAAAQATGAVNF